MVLATVPPPHLPERNYERPPVRPDFRKGNCTCWIEIDPQGFSSTDKFSELIA